MDSIVSSGIGSSNFSTAAIPASRRSHSNEAPAASRMRTVASVMSGPMPSPGINVQGTPIWESVSTSGGEEIGHAAGEASGDGGCEVFRAVALHITLPGERRGACVHEHNVQQR